MFDIWTTYQQMFTIRSVEERLLELFSEGLLSGTVHTCIGQEACAVGVVGALDKTIDVVTSNHRGHGHYLMHSDFDIKGLIGEVCGRIIGVNKGLGGSQHLHRSNYFSSGVQGGLLAASAGMAFAEKESNSDGIICTFLGDGTLGQGILYETMNIAAKWEAPLLLVVEANHYAQTTPTNVQHAGNLIDRAQPFGIESSGIKVRDPELVRNAARNAVDYVRNEKKPYFLVLDTYRLGPHSKGDDHRDPAEIQRYREIDPLVTTRENLAGIDADRIAKIEGSTLVKIDNIVDEVLASSAPSMNDICL
jgi:TPP-dependent pyruvate/acetoin dehydrogenase alpha subunit